MRDGDILERVCSLRTSRYKEGLDKLEEICSALSSRSKVRDGDILERVCSVRRSRSKEAIRYITGDLFGAQILI